MSRIIGRNPFKGRGALSNPGGRFESEDVERVHDGWYVDEQPTAIATTVTPDRARGIITSNDSPDIPFERSINPYRGCEHGCVYCVAAETPILMGDGTTRPMDAIRVGDEIYGTVREGWYRRYTKTRVLAHWSVVKPAYLIFLEDGTELIAGGDHRFLTERGWKFVTGAEQGVARRPHLTTGNKLMGTGAFLAPPEHDADYRRGYLCGLIRGDGMLFTRVYAQPNGGSWELNQFRLALCDTEALIRAQEWLRDWQIETRNFQFCAASATRRQMHAIRAGSRASVDAIRGLIAWPNSACSSWRRGFLAGIFDAEGSYSEGILRISNTDPEIIGWICDSLRASCFKFVVEHTPHQDRKPIDVVRLLGGLPEHLRFFHGFDPAISRKLDISGQAVKSAAKLGVGSIERLPGAMRLYDITTGTEDFIANGVVSHNCYARPSHAYMGLSSGIDFETKLFYKADAGKLLEEELAHPKYVCKSITIGANTDPYQPVERELLVTRSILEVLAKTRHPASIITKSAMILRDLDLLKEMAADGLINVAISITSLSAETKRVLEPRTASPQARLRAVRELNAAGVPAGVMVAPIIPAITDQEMEAILAEAAAAGAVWAAYTLVRLPYEIKDLFRDWLTEHFPDRAAHVMALIHDMRGGRDNDPRFFSRRVGSGPIADLLRNRFKIACNRLGLNGRGRDTLDRTRLFQPPVRPGSQLTLGL
jgi:DNA repair photolyase